MKRAWRGIRTVPGTIHSAPMVFNTCHALHCYTCDALVARCSDDCSQPVLQRTLSLGTSVVRGVDASVHLCANPDQVAHIKRPFWRFSQWDDMMRRGSSAQHVKLCVCILIHADSPALNSKTCGFPRWRLVERMPLHVALLSVILVVALSVSLSTAGTALTYWVALAAVITDPHEHVYIPQ